ncbi:barstar family protein [Nocardioides coralli]|uniref:barstar family protein n=1 Tax=Nocardioides coralli TaxID=2872154 RepID=UPI001CA3E1C7|nr:barstar family protein [Nocardioides coralli]QZY27982.1 barstar family protein [Nocardioides coralli]
MSGLAAVLARHQQPGIYRWHAGFDVADVCHAVEHAGWRFGYVDGLAAQTKSEFLARVGEALEFPDWYGQNFDALADCLSDVDGGDGTVLLWDGWGAFARSEPQAFSVALSVLGTRVNAERGGPFSVLMRGEGPEVTGVTWLD